MASRGDVAEPALHSGFLELPSTFVLGAATAAFQIEGGATQGGRKPSIWDDFARLDGKVTEGATGDVACDHYNRMQDDVDLMADLGLKAYRFSISWSRLIPDGDGAINEEGAQFYSNLINALLAKGIEPWVTLYHWDMPSALEAKFGGWRGPKADVQAAFCHYAQTCFERFGDRVKRWITINEPWCIAMLGYNTGEHAPGRSEAGDTEPYIVGHNMLLAHAAAARLYRERFSEEQGGLVGITLNTGWSQPWNPESDDDKQAARQAMDFSLGWFADPVHFGDYPQSMRSACGRRLPEFSVEEKKLLAGSSDFFGLNFYSANFACFGRKPGGVGYWKDIGVEWWHSDSGWEKTDMDWSIVPWGLRELLIYVHSRYNPAHGIYITENGCALEPEDSASATTRASGAGADTNATFEDPERVRFFRAHLSAVHAAVAHGADVRGYFAWSLLDNFEWAYGYTKRFGIVHVDYATQTRVVKSSGRFIAQVIQEGGFQAPSRNEQYGGCTF